MTLENKDWTLRRVTEAEAAAIRLWAGRARQPVRGPHGLPLSTIGAYALALSDAEVREREYPSYAEDEDMSPLLVLAGPRSRWEASGVTGRIRPADIARLQPPR